MKLRNTLREKALLSIVAPLLLVALAACDSLLEVDLPGNVVSTDLNDPDLAETLVLSVQADFECGFVDYMVFPGQWFEEFQNTSQSRPDALSGLRSNLLSVYADPCDSGTGPIWTTIQVPRQQARLARTLIESFDPAEVADRDFLLAKARMYEAYSIQLLGEQFCDVTVDVPGEGVFDAQAGPLLGRDGAYQLAITRFSEAISFARAAGDVDIENASLVGRARAKLHLGDFAGVVADASQVSSGFQYLATYDANPGRRRNRIHERMNRGDQEIPHRDYWDLEINTTTGLSISGTEPLQGTAAADVVPDPRVVVRVESQDEPRGFTKYRTQQKYTSDGADIPFSTWREAQIMIAEADPAQALTIINNLRTSTTGLPAGVDGGAWPLPTISAATWSGLTAAEQTTVVREERRRELWMQGVQAGDKVRWGYPGWDTEDMYNQQLGPGGCIPVPFLEQTSNPNL